MREQYKHQLAEARRAILLLAALLLAAGGLSPLSSLGNASAASVTQRSVTIGSGLVSASTTYTINFVPGTAAAIQGLKFQACTTALGTCTAPAGLSFSSAGGGTVSGSWTNATNFTVDAVGANDCVASASILCAKRTQAASETTSGVRTVAFTTVTNPDGSSCATVNCTFFVRMTTYNNTTWTSGGGGLVDTGTVASSTTQTVTVNFAIQESLTFCIGVSTINDAGTTTPPDCSGISGTSLNLGTAVPADVSVSPVSAGNGGDGNNGIGELSTNASNGATVTYDAVQQSGTNHQGTLRVSGASCSAGASNTDQCIDAVGTTQATITAGTENFGMTIAAINCMATTAYTCSFAGNTYHLSRNTNYDGTGANTYPTDTDLVAGTTNAGYAWDETGTAATIASSSTVVDKEAMILKFAATPNIVTPTGSYTAKADFIATPTF